MKTMQFIAQYYTTAIHLGKKEKCCLTASIDSTMFEVQSTKTFGRRRNASRLVNTAFTTRTASPGSLLV